MGERRSLVGLMEIAQMFGVQQHTTAMWRYRGVLPTPDYVISTTPIWELATILAWARETHRTVVASPPAVELGGRRPSGGPGPRIRVDQQRIPSTVDRRVSVTDDGQHPERDRDAAR